VRRTRLGLVVGGAVGPPVGDRLGVSVGSSEGVAVGSPVGEGVGPVLSTTRHTGSRRQQVMAPQGLYRGLKI
jgi:hypothetical protein